MKLACSTELRMQGKVSLKFNRVIFILNYNKQFIKLANIMITMCMRMSFKQPKLINQIVNKTILSKKTSSVVHRGQITRNMMVATYAFTSDKQSSMKTKTPLESLLSKYKGQIKSLSNFESGALLKQLLQFTNNQVSNVQDNATIQDCVGHILTNFNNFMQSTNTSKWQSKENVSYVVHIAGCLSLHNFIKVVNRFSNQQKRESILKIVKDKKLASVLITMFESEEYLGRTKIIKFVTKFHNQDPQLMRSLCNAVKNSTNKEARDLKQLIFYLKQITKLSSLPNSTADLIDLSLFKQAISKAEQNILMVDPQMLFILSQSMLVLSKSKHKSEEIKKIVQAKLLIDGTREHIKGLELIDARNLNDGVYLVQVLENVKDLGNQGIVVSNEQIRQLANNIYGFIKKAFKRIAQSAQQQQLSSKQDDKLQTVSSSESPLTPTHSLSQIDINILQQSMLSLQIIDPTLFTVLQQLFFINISKQASHLYDIQSYIYTRIKISKAVMSSLRESTSKSMDKIGTDTGGRVRIVKQQHKKFIVRLIEQLNRQKQDANQSKSSGSITNSQVQNSVEGITNKNEGSINNNKSKNDNIINPKETYSLQQKLKILQICQKLPIKSKQVKRIITQMMEKHKDDKEITGFAETIKASF